MKTVWLIFTSLTLAFTFTLNAQNYRIINPAREYYYGWYPSAVDHTLKDVVCGIHIDSVIAAGSDTLYFNYPATDYYSGGGGNCNLTFKDTSWVGRYVLVRPGGNYYFFNYAGDTIQFKSQAQLNDTWRFFNLGGGDYLEARVVSIDTQTVVGILDSVKTILLSAYDSAGNPISHLSDGMRLGMSQNHGLTMAPDFHRFPVWSGSAVNLFGTTNPPSGIRLPSAADYFDFHPNDTLQTHHIDQWQNGFYEFYEQKVYLSGDLSPHPDSLRYQYHFQKQSHGFSNGNHTYTFLDTIQFQEIDLNDPGFQRPGSLPGESRVPELCANIRPDQISLQNYGYNSRWLMFDDNCNYRFDTVYQCFVDQVLTYGCGFFFIEGLGGGYYVRPGGIFEIHYLPVYFNKGGEIWGNPVNFDSLMARENPSSQLTELLLFPNPVNELSRIEINAAEHINFFNLEILDLNGRLITNSGKLQGRSAFISAFVPELPGVYFLKVKTDSGRTATMKLLK